jgi:hypothetical protein
MKISQMLIGIGVCALLVLWNYQELSSVIQSEKEELAIPLENSLPVITWKSFDSVVVQTKDQQSKLVSLPPELEVLDGKDVIISGSTFACGEDLIRREDGCTIKGFIMVPYFGMIDCCVGNPIPYFQWTIIAKNLHEPWEIKHPGIIDPSAVVRGRFRIERGLTEEGIFYLDNAVVVDSVEHAIAAGRKPSERLNICK